MCLLIIVASGTTCYKQLKTITSIPESIEERSVKYIESALMHCVHH